MSKHLNEALLMDAQLHLLLEALVAFALLYAVLFCAFMAWKSFVELTPSGVEHWWRRLWR